MQYVVVLVLLFLLYQYWKKRQEEPKVKKSKGSVIDIDVVRQSDLEKGPFPYKKKTYLQERFERLMFEGLKHYLEDYTVEVYPQVNVFKLLYVPQTTRSHVAWLNRLYGKSVDFVICDSQTLEPLAVICLDQMNANAAEQQESRAFLEKAFQEAGLPFLRFMASDEGYNWEDIMMEIQPWVQNKIRN